jgi:phage baseplate assembly protein W
MTAGIDRSTGKVLAGWPHVVQSIGVILTTPVGQRIMREWFGSPVPALLGENITPRTFLRFMQAIVVALELYEPRFKVRRVQIGGTAESIRMGEINLTVLGDYRPRALQGDLTVEGTRSVIIGGDQSAGIAVS